MEFRDSRAYNPAFYQAAVGRRLPNGSLPEKDSLIDANIRVGKDKQTIEISV